MEWISWWQIPCALLLIATVVFLLARLRYTRIPLLKVQAGGTDEAPVDCMVVIPARNEASMIAAAVASFPKDTVIVVNDDSTDQTADRARAAGAGVIAAPALPRGAFGKPNACKAGAAVLQSRWILFVDADTRYKPAFLKSLVATAEASQMDFISVHLPIQPGFGMELLGPYMLALYYAVVSPRNRPLAAFRGQCVLARRAPYEFVGGHASLIRHFAEDTHLAASAQRHRMRFGTVRAGSLGYARFHKDGVIEGVRRELYRALDASPLVLAPLLLWSLVAFFWLPCVIWLWYAGYTWLALGAIPLGFLWLAGWYKGLRLLLAPLAIYAMAPMLLILLLPLLTGRVPQWKGRTR